MFNNCFWSVFGKKEAVPLSHKDSDILAICLEPKIILSISWNYP